MIIFNRMLHSPKLSAVRSRSVCWLSKAARPSSERRAINRLLWNSSSIWERSRWWSSSWSSTPSSLSPGRDPASLARILFLTSCSDRWQDSVGECSPVLRFLHFRTARSWSTSRTDQAHRWCRRQKAFSLEDSSSILRTANLGRGHAMCKRRRDQSTISQCIVQVEVGPSRSVCTRGSPGLRRCWDTWWRAGSLGGRPELLLLLFDYYYLIIIITWEGGQSYYYYYLIIII